MPTAAVATSISSVVRRVPAASRAPAAAGAANCTTDCMVALMPLQRIRCCSGTRAGSIAPTAGVWTPAPRERMADMTSSAASRPFSVGNRGITSAMARVTAAITPSARMMIRRRLKRSAHTPAGKDIRNCGRYAPTVKAATHAPLEVVSVTYQMTAICTIIDPRSVTHWLMRKSAVRLFQLLVT